MKIGQSAGKDYAYVIGVLLGDGCICEALTQCGKMRPWFRLNTIDEDFAMATRRALESLAGINQFGRRYAVTICLHDVKGGQPNYALAFSDPVLIEHLRIDTARKMQIPSWLFEASREEQIAFIAGLMDSEGFVAKVTGNPTNRGYYMGYKSCDVWVPEFCRLLDIVGVRYGKVSQCPPSKPGRKVPTRFTIKMQSWIDAGCYFNIMRKQSRVDEWASHLPYTQRAVNPRRSTPETTRRTDENHVLI